MQGLRNVDLEFLVLLDLLDFLDFLDILDILDILKVITCMRIGFGWVRVTFEPRNAVKFHLCCTHHISHFIILLKSFG